jgi:hypothetical protein
LETLILVKAQRDAERVVFRKVILRIDRV